MVIAMLDTVDFYEKQIKECSAQAARAANKADREFWLGSVWLTDGHMYYRPKDFMAVLIWRLCAA